MKLCPRCQTSFDGTAFYKCAANADGLQTYCKYCHKNACAASKDKNPEKYRLRKKSWYQENKEDILLHYETTKERRRETTARWAKKHPEQCALKYRSWRTRNPERAREVAKRAATTRRLRQYGLTLDSYQALKEAQNFLCAVCGEIPATLQVGKNAEKLLDDFIIEHDHSTGRVRSLACYKCNVAIGMVRERPDIARKIAVYLEKHSAIDPA